MKKQTTAGVKSRDRDLLIILFAIVIGFICYYIVISPSIDRGIELKAQQETVIGELDRAKDVVANLPEIKKQEGIKKEELIEKYKPFFYELNQERILNKMHELMLQTNLPVTAYTPTTVSVSAIPVLKDEYQAPEYPLLDFAEIVNPELAAGDEENTASGSDRNSAGSDQSASAPDAVPSVDIVMKVSGATYPSVLDFIKKLEEMNKTMLIKNVALNRAETGLDGQVVVALYSLPKLDESEKDYLEFLPVSALGKADPFQ